MTDETIDCDECGDELDTAYVSDDKKFCYWCKDKTNEILSVVDNPKADNGV